MTESDFQIGKATFLSLRNRVCAFAFTGMCVFLVVYAHACGMCVDVLKTHHLCRREAQRADQSFVLPQRPGPIQTYFNRVGDGDASVRA